MNGKFLKIIILLFFSLLLVACGNRTAYYHDTEEYESFCGADVEIELTQDAATDENETNCDEAASEQGQELVKGGNAETVEESCEETLQKDDPDETNDIPIQLSVEQLLELLEFTPFDPSAVEISEYGRQVATDFLRQMTTIFTGVVEAEVTQDDELAKTGRFLLGWERDETNNYRHVSYRRVTTYEVPEVYFVPENWMVRSVYDREGERITDAPWLCNAGSAYFAVTDFRLFDFNNSGIPDIWLRFSPIFDLELTFFIQPYRFIDGEYRMLELDGYCGYRLRTLFWASAPLFFVDDSNRIIYFDNSELRPGYRQLTVTDSAVALHYLLVFDHCHGSWEGWDVWTKHHWGEWIELSDGSYFLDGWHFHNPTIFGTDIALTPFTSLTDLEAEIFAYLQHERQSNQ